MKRRISHLMIAIVAVALPLVFAASCTETKTLKTQVQTKLDDDRSVSTAHLVVDTRGNVVVLTGNVDSQEAKDRAIELARSVPGVTDVEDMISVRTSEGMGNAPEPNRSVGEHIDDAAITMAVKTRLLADPLVKGTKIDVDTREGVVYLTGTVSNAQERNKAIELAEGTENVKKVEANLDVSS